jgi:hypothetical protein
MTLCTPPCSENIIFGNFRQSDNVSFMAHNSVLSPHL